MLKKGINSYKNRWPHPDTIKKLKLKLKLSETWYPGLLPHPHLLDNRTTVNIGQSLRGDFELNLVTDKSLATGL